ncbi:MAG: ATP-binding protein [Bacteroidaceae bacterium]|nr:ATP-binding protein [Bacteroidaceae bacterium]
MNIKRDLYLQQLIDRQHNGMIKVVTGVRRCGKSYLVFNLFSNYLKSNGVDDKHIIKVNLENRRNKKLRNPDALLEYIDAQLIDQDMYYILLDEVQLVDEFEDVLNSYLDVPNADVYVTGSNARFLSKDVITEFRGRGDEVKIYPLSFAEFMSAFGGSNQLGLDEYMTFGGLPLILSYKTEEQKSAYLKNLFEETYIKDIKERYQIRHEEEFEELLNIISSSIGSLTNPTKLSKTFQSVKHVTVNPETIKYYLEYLCDSFLVSKAMRYDVKGKKYIDTPYKYYFTDMGLRNARINFRQDEKTHLMENVIYNELLIRGFNVDVGVVPVVTRDADGKQVRTQLEIDFVCNQGSKRYYIQSAFRMNDEEKQQNEQAPLTKVNDSFKKIIITGEEGLIHRNEQGITTMSIYDFLLNPNALEL